MLTRPETVISLPPDVASLPPAVAKLVAEHERLTGEYRAATRALSNLDSDRPNVERRDAEDSAKALRAGKPVKEQAHLAAHVKAVGAARHLAVSLATAADSTASDLVEAVEKVKPTLVAKAEQDIEAAEQDYTKAVEALELANRSLSAARGQRLWASRFPERSKSLMPESITVPLVGVNGSEYRVGDVLSALRSVA